MELTGTRAETFFHMCVSFPSPNAEKKRRIEEERKLNYNEQYYLMEFCQSRPPVYFPFLTIMKWFAFNCFHANRPYKNLQFLDLPVAFPVTPPETVSQLFGTCLASHFLFSAFIQCLCCSSQTTVATTSFYHLHRRLQQRRWRGNSSETKRVASRLPDLGKELVCN